MKQFYTRRNHKKISDLDRIVTADLDCKSEYKYYSNFNQKLDEHLADTISLRLASSILPLSLVGLLLWVVIMTQFSYWYWWR